MARTGVYPVFENKFKIGATKESLNTVADLETFSISIDGNTEEWSPMDADGWMRRMNTGKALTISLSGKRNIGDAGNDFVADIAWKTGVDCNAYFQWEFPSGAKLEFDCVVDVKNVGGGDSRNVAGLEFDVLSDGKPTYTAAT